MPPKIPPNTSPIPARPSWRDHEDWIDDLKNGPKPKPPPGDGKAWPPSEQAPDRFRAVVMDEPAHPGDYEEIARRARESAPIATMTVEARGDWSPLFAAADGDPIPPELDDAGISLDYDPVESCASTFANIIAEELHEGDPVVIEADEDLPSVTIGAFTFTISTTIRGGAERLARALHALGEALLYNVTERDAVEPCHACIAEEE